jgi:nucleotide-binding universal stress UspA family protein
LRVVELENEVAELCIARPCGLSVSRTEVRKMKSDPIKLLLAVDGSNQSLEAVRYVSHVFTPQQTKVVLFHVLSKVPEFFYDLGKNPPHRGEVINKWETALRDSIENFMSQARQLLIDGGIPHNAMEIKIRSIEAGITRDIIAESMSGYRALVVGRSGLSESKDFPIGSVSNKLIEKLSHCSVWVVGGNPTPGRILLAVDESDGAQRAVDYVGTMLYGAPFEATLLHVVRRPDRFHQRFQNVFSQNFEKEWIDAGRNKIESMFDGYRSLLMRAGFDEGRLTTKLITGVSSRAGAIIEEARKGGYGTIVVGRRGLSKVQEFFMGRVSRKVIQLGTEQAVWVVS